MAFPRYLMLLALIVWMGGIFFFAFVLAPTAFSVLPTHRLAGSLVGKSLITLHWVGFVSGIVFLVSSLISARMSGSTMQIFAARNLLVVGMLALTLVSQFAIIPRMDSLRASLPDDIASVAKDDPTRMKFDSLHRSSTRVEGGVLLLGLAVVYVIASGW
jgi:uncharacterized membrane protein